MDRRTVSHYDTIVIGAGHNGLICATQLARRGRRVVLVEASGQVGGLAADREFFPGFHAAVAQSLYAIPTSVLKELGLGDYGFDDNAQAMDLVALSPNESPIHIGEELRGASEADTATYANYQKQMRTFAKALSSFWGKKIPAIGANSIKELFTFAQIGLKLRLLGRDDMLEFFRIASLPMRDLADENFESEALKAALCWDGLVGSKMAPRSPNQAVITLLYRMAGANHGAHTLHPGGMQSFVNALRDAAVAAGVEIRLGSGVKKICVDGDEDGQRVSGVELADGEIISASEVASSADPKNTFLKMVGAPQLEIEFSNRIRRLRADGYVAKLHLALKDLPNFTGLEQPNGRMILASCMDDIEFAFDDAKYGEHAQEPVMEVTIPSLQQRDIAPHGQHVLSANVMYVAPRGKDGWTEELRADLSARVMATLERYAPGIGELTLHAELLTPDDLEAEYQLSGGHWHHAEPAIDQLLMMRPTYEAAQYRTPIDGLFLCGAGSHPGGDLSGYAGLNAAREILA